MGDPISTVLLAAGVGGLGGKVVEKAWESGERWLLERFGSHSETVQASARQNAAAFVSELASRVEVLEKNNRVSAETVSVAQTDPAFSALLQRTILNASQTSDPQKANLLAQLVANRLASEAESTYSLASQLAADAIRNSTRHHLNLMAFLSFMEDLRPRDEGTTDYHVTWTEVHLEPFRTLTFSDIDGRHLAAIGCATYDPTSERDLVLLLQIKGGTHCIGESDVGRLPAVLDLQGPWIEGLAGVTLTSTGSIVGSLAYDEITGKSVGPPAWTKSK